VYRWFLIRASRSADESGTIVPVVWHQHRH
jgi:hypothetical protein